MNQPPRWKTELRDLAARVEEEAAHSVDYVNDRMVPVVRRETLRALHRATGAIREASGRWEARLAAEQARSGGRR